MPHYDYECPKCKKVIEVIKSIKDESDEKCETCGAVMKRQVANSGSFRLRGSGWPSKDIKRFKK